MKPLVLSGRASEVPAALDGGGRQLLRVRSRQGRAQFDRSDQDAWLIRDQDDLSWMASENLPLALVVGPDFPAGNGEAGFIRLPDEFAYLGDGDLISLDPSSKRLRVFYRHNSRHNSLLVTERCNHYCLMCSQPPKDVADHWLLEEIAAAIPLMDPKIPSLGFTGGETLTDWRRFIEVLTLARDKLPSTALHVLTNGRAFANPDIAAAWADIQHPNLVAGIPVYSAVDHIHDHVVQARGALDETILGILRLKELGQRVEIRVVLHALTAPGIQETGEWLARNLPFVDHVAFMGLENTGFAIANEAELWIDPVDYASALTRAVRALQASRVPVSIYNLPLCLVERDVRGLAVQSISDWKNGYVAECGSCEERQNCAGFFSSGRPRFSRGIAPISRGELVQA